MVFFFLFDDTIVILISLKLSDLRHSKPNILQSSPNIAYLLHIFCMCTSIEKNSQKNHFEIYLHSCLRFGVTAACNSGAWDGTSCDGMPVLGGVTRSALDIDICCL